jgi:hypothetical protein
MYTTPPGTVDREAEEKIIEEEEEAERQATEAVKAQPPGFDKLGPTQSIKPEDLSETDPTRPSTYLDHVAKALDKAEERLDKGPKD